MTAEIALAELAEFIKKETILNIVIASDSVGADGEEELTFQRLTLAEGVSSQFFENASATVDRIKDLNLIEHDLGYKQDDHELCYIPLEKSEMAKNIVKSFSSLDQLPLFRESEEIIDNLRFYAMVVQARSKQAIFFRSFTPKNELARGGFTPLVFRKDVYDRLKEKVFLFDNDIDCIAFEGYLFILNDNQFRRIFRYFEALVAIADETFSRILPRIPIEGMEEFTAMCRNNLLMLSKLSQIARKPYIEDLTMDDLTRTIAEFALPLVVRDGKIVFDPSRKTRRLILTLLDDDHLGSSMTKLKYRSNSKVSL